MTAFRAITLTQPWCGLMAAGIKRIENRSQPIIRREFVGQDIAFHASREISEHAMRRIVEIAPELCTDPSLPWFRMGSVTSAITHVARLVDILRGKHEAQRAWSFDEALARGTVVEQQRRWWFGQHGYVFDNERVLSEPLPCRGWQGCWTLSPEIITQLAERLVS